MKKIVSVVLALMMVFSMFATVSATPISGYLTPTSGPFLSYTLPVNIMAQRSGTTPDAYAASPLNIVDSNPSGGIGVDFKTTLDMSQLRTFFSETLPSLYANLDSEAKTEFDQGTVNTDVTVTIAYAGATVANRDIAGGLLNDNNQIFHEESRTFGADDKSVVIKYNNKKDGNDGFILTAADLVTNAATYLEDLVFELKDSAVYNAYGTYEVKVTFSGQTTIDFYSVPGNQDVVIDYPQSEATYSVSISAPSSGGGGSSYNSIKLETNGGNELKNVSVRRGQKAELPTPVRDGYVFAGWYTDSALTNPFDTDTVINRNYTLYAKWVESGECEGTVEDNCPCLKYDDLDPTMWYHKGVDYVLNSGMMIGVDTTKFAPDWDVTRAMLVTVLWRAEGKPAAGNTTFTDLEDGLYYVDAVKWAAENGVVNGYSDTVFAPNDAITREQFAAIMYRYAKNKGYDVSVGENTNILSYSDYDAISEYAIEAMQYALGSGLIKGRTETTLNPKDNTTRAEMATILYRFFTESK